MQRTVHQEAGNDHSHNVIVNGRCGRIADPKPSGSQILAETGFEPPDEHILIEKAKIGSRLISLDQSVDIRRSGEIPEFYAFRTGEVLTFTVNDHGFQWGKRIITEAEIREIARVPDDHLLILERGEDEDRILRSEDQVELCSVGTEHLRTERRLVKVFIDDLEKEISRGIYTTEELIAVLGVQAGYLLNLATKHGLEPLAPGRHIAVRDGMKFFSQVPGGAAS
jgi:hypothetical protein